MTQFKKFVLARYCEGLPKPEDFRLETGEPPEPADGEFRVRHIWNSVDPGVRARLSGSDFHSRAVDLGETIPGLAVGEVDQSRNPDFPVGARVFCRGGWATHSCHAPGEHTGLIPESSDGLPLSLWIGVLGVPGLAAWFGLRRVAHIEKGANVLVTSAAGTVGATAGQLAAHWGAGRVVGVAGSAEKCAWLTEEAEFDAAINHRETDDLGAAIARELPDGVDILFDNVGNGVIDLVLPMMRQRGHIVVSGQTGDYSRPEGDFPGIFNTAPFITRRLNMQGFIVYDDVKEFPEARSVMASLIGSDKIKYVEDRREGLDCMPQAFRDLFTGATFGRCVIAVTA